MADPLQEPALQPPPGVISQFPTIHSDKQAWFYVVATLCAVVPGTLLFLRLYTKFYIIRKRDATDCSTYPFRSPPPFTPFSFVRVLTKIQTLSRYLS